MPMYRQAGFEVVLLLTNFWRLGKAGAGRADNAYQYRDSLLHKIVISNPKAAPWDDSHG